jgi:choline-sulfatase
VIVVVYVGWPPAGNPVGELTANDCAAKATDGAAHSSTPVNSRTPRTRPITIGEANASVARMRRFPRHIRIDARAERGSRVRQPNVLLIITDQQRYQRHWPDDAGWHDALMPNDAELARTGIRFTRAFCNTAMCSPSRATLLTGRYPAEHGVTLTLTAADLRPDPRNTPAVIRTAAGILARREVPPRRVVRQFVRGALRLGPSAGNEPTLPSDVANMATLLRGAGYTVAWKGKWHLTHPSAHGRPDAMLGGWTAADATILSELGFTDWEPPDAGENAKAEHFGGGNAGTGEGWDELYTEQAEAWLRRAGLPEPFCLIVSLVNPHDVLGYPASYVAGGYSADEFRDLGVGLPPTIDEDLRSKPSVHSLMRIGTAAYLGPLGTRAAQRDYVNFYAHLHRVVDRKIGRLLSALGPVTDPESLRSRTVVVRCSDHGELGLAHGGLRQKMFNAYEETINVPLVFSNPVLFPEPSQTDALASLVDVLPTLLTLAGQSPPDDLRGRDLTPILSHTSPGLDHPARPSVRESVHFTYDDHQAGTAMQEAPGQPNRVRAVRTDSAKYAVYLDPRGRARSEYELYDLAEDPHEERNLLDVRTGLPSSRRANALRRDLADALEAEMAACRTGWPRAA